MTNLLKETKGVLELYKQLPSNIIFIGSQESGHSCTWKEFELLADQEYDAGYGAAKVALDLIIIFQNGSRLDRREYDGSEWWEFQTPFKTPTEQKPITTLFSEGWKILAECQEEKDDETL